MLTPYDVRREVDRVPARFVSVDERFGRTDGDAHLERLFGNGRWTEGPAYFPAGRYLVFSDIPNDRLLRWDEATGAVGALRQPAGFTNGHTVDRAGRLVSCEQGNRRVTRTEHDGSITVLADRYRGKQFNSPNDVVERADGSVWFTDPSYGISTDYEGHAAEPELDGCHVYRVDPHSGEVRMVSDEFERPNGLAFSADEETLYIADTRRKHIRRFNVAESDNLTGGEVIATCDAGSFDGLRVDAKGRIWAAAHDGLHCFAPDGTLLGKLLVPEIVSNLTFGGPQRNHLFITATTSVYTLRVNFSGVSYPR
jgi:gluconolactonase